MGEDTIETGVDKLLALFHGNERISVTAAAKRLNLTEEVVQSWVDFLVEERILGTEFKFSKQYIYLNQPVEIQPKIIQQEKISLDSFHDDFVKRAKEKKLPESKIEQFWQDHLRRELQALKDFFFTEAKRKKIQDIEGLWNTYIKEVVGA
ncbi:MAG: hypothetical protein HC945_01015 [Nitrosarchaeum sp.]|nr:hypothetical protein [Nitrosarchaeum sp.]